jgi:predicted AlkP superfamily pyrophosphatase or phosphodiesterase
MLPASAYLYDATATGAVPPAGLGAAFPHPLRGKPDSTGPDAVFYDQWQTSPYADTYLTRIAETAVDKLELGARAGTDFLAVSYSSLDYVGHAFGPRSWEIQDLLARLDQDLAELFAHLDEKVGRGNYVVALSADHGVVPIPEDMQKSGMEAGWLNVESVKEGIEKSLQPFNYAKPAVAKVGASAVYFTPGTYDKLKNDPVALRAVLEAIQSVPGVAHVYRAEEVEDRPSTQSPMRKAEAAGFFKARSGDLLIVPKPYWPWDSSTPASPREYGAAHGTPHSYDQRVPVLLMGYGIQSGEYFQSITPADIAPTLAALCGITLAPRDGRVLAEALKNSSASPDASRRARAAALKQP